jgi:hypothetical protein
MNAAMTQPKAPSPKKSSRRDDGSTDAKNADNFAHVEARKALEREEEADLRAEEREAGACTPMILACYRGICCEHTRNAKFFSWFHEKT